MSLLLKDLLFHKINLILISLKMNHLNSRIHQRKAALLQKEIINKKKGGIKMISF